MAQLNAPRPQAAVTKPLTAEEAAALHAAIVVSSNEAIISKTLDGTITSWNAATTNLFGWLPKEMIGRSIRLLIPDDRQSEEDTILREIAEGRRIENYETVRIRKDRSSIEVSVTISPIRDANGAIVGASKIVRDITLRRQSERQIALLMAEVNHRAKNLLGLIQAIANQSDAESVEAFRGNLTARLRALAINQDMLISTNWTGVGLSGLIAGALEPFPPTVTARVSIAGPAFILAPTASQTLSMTFHELASNAVRHGALSNDAGRVAISWSCDSEFVTMLWQEEGGPVVSQPDIKRFGNKVIIDLVETRLGGKVALKYPANGIEWCLRAAKSRVELDGSKHD